MSPGRVVTRRDRLKGSATGIFHSPSPGLIPPGESFLTPRGMSSVTRGPGPCIHDWVSIPIGFSNEL